MDRRGMDRFKSGAARLGLGLGTLGFGCLTVSLFLGPTYVGRWRSGMGGDLFLEPPAPSRMTVGAELLEAQFADGFWEIAEVAARAPEPPSWEALRRILEERGKTDLWFSVRLRWLMDDGDGVVITYIRRPYQSRMHFNEFLKLASAARSEAGRAWAEEHGFDREAGAGTDARLPSWLIENLMRTGRLEG